MSRFFSLFLLIFVTSPAFAQWKLDEKLKISNPDDLKNVESTEAPKGAVILFDGKNVDAWTKRDGKPAEWKILDGTMQGVPGHGDIITKEKFGGSFKLHIEFRVPYEPEGKGQGRGNSGVYVQGRYEVQVLDSYGLKSQKNDCAAIYGIAAPTKNACKAPTIWQSYDIEFHSPVFVNGKKTEPSRMTVYHNGVLVHDDVKIDSNNTTAGMGGDPSKPGPILLQDHGHPVQYRNLWLLPLQK